MIKPDNCQSTKTGGEFCSDQETEWRTDQIARINPISFLNTHNKAGGPHNRRTRQKHYNN